MTGRIQTLYAPRLHAAASHPSSAALSLTAVIFVMQRVCGGRADRSRAPLVSALANDAGSCQLERTIIDKQNNFRQAGDRFRSWDSARQARTTPALGSVSHSCVPPPGVCIAIGAPNAVSAGGSECQCCKASVSAFRKWLSPSAATQTWLILIQGLRCSCAASISYGCMSISCNALLAQGRFIDRTVDDADGAHIWSTAASRAAGCRTCMQVDGSLALQGAVARLQQAILLTLRLFILLRL